MRWFSAAGLYIFMPWLLSSYGPDDVDTPSEDFALALTLLGVTILPAAVGVLWSRKAVLFHVGGASIIIAVVGGISARDAGESLLVAAGVRPGIFFVAYLAVALVANVIAGRVRRHRRVESSEGLPDDDVS